MSTNDTLLPNPIIHYDKFTFPSIIDHLILFICFTIGIIVCILCFVFQWLYRDKKIMKFSSPRINNILLSGGIIIYIHMILDFYAPIGYYNNINEYLNKKYIHQKDINLIERSMDHVSCHVMRFILSFAMLYPSALFGRVYRVYRIYSNKRLKAVKITDIQLYKLILKLVFCDLINTAMVCYFFPPYIELHWSDIIYNEKDNEMIHTITQRCRITYLSMAIINLPRCLVAIIGSYMAFRTRKIKNREFNDSAYLCASFCYGVPFVVFLTSIFILFPESRTYSYIASFLGITSSLLTMFLPKWMYLHKKSVVISIGRRTSANARIARVDEATEIEIVPKNNYKVNKVQKPSLSMNNKL